MLSWIRESRVAGGQEMTSEWAHLAQDRAGWHKLATEPPFAIGCPLCGNYGATPG